jgi:hypothetical protein
VRTPSAAATAQAPGLRQEIARRVLGAEPSLDRVAVKADIRLLAGEALAHRDAQLPFDQIDPGDRFSDGMLDLRRVFISMK